MAKLPTMAEIANRMKNQDHRATAHPIYMVQQRRRYYGIDLDYDPVNRAWLYDGEAVATSEEGLEEWLRANELTAERAEATGMLVETGYMDVWEWVQPFFSQRAAEDYIDKNRHNLTDPCVYVASGHRNDEWIGVRQALVGGEV